jgi:hypothetical protein
MNKQRNFLTLIFGSDETSKAELVACRPTMTATAPATCIAALADDAVNEGPDPVWERGAKQRSVSKADKAKATFDTPLLRGSLLFTLVLVGLLQPLGGGQSISASCRIEGTLLLHCYPPPVSRVVLAPYASELPGAAEGYGKLRYGWAHGGIVVGPGRLGGGGGMKRLRFHWRWSAVQVSKEVLGQGLRIGGASSRISRSRPEGPGRLCRTLGEITARSRAGVAKEIQ